MQRFAEQEVRVLMKVPVSLRNRIKNNAAKRGIYIMQYVWELVDKDEKNNPQPQVTAQPSTPQPQVTSP